MRRIVAVLGIAVVLAGVAASGATADPSTLKVRLDSKAELLTPVTLRIAVSYRCAEDAGTALIEVVVSQGEARALTTDATGVDAPCTGRWETLVLTLGPFFDPDPAAFAPGTAEGEVFASLGGEFESEARKVRVVA